jgi:ubiquitin carboxyl-terminal hydrolase 9/24
MTDSSLKLDSESSSQFDYEDEEEYIGDSDYNIYSTSYQLVGIVVHSGQANGGHYYSFIKNRTSSGSDTLEKVAESSEAADSSSDWFKFDDNDVSEFKMDDEELRNQCYGGDYTGEVYDNVMKRMAYKKQKRWWNAYILFYERIKLSDLPATAQAPADSSKSSTPRSGANTTAHHGSARLIDGAVEKRSTALNVKMPSYVLKSVLKKNIKFLHQRNHFSPEYFYFLKKLMQTNLIYCQSEANVNIGSIDVSLI